MKSMFEQWIPKTHVWLVFFVPSLLLMAPVLLSNPFQNILGNEYSDSFKHLWSFWHTPKNLLSWPHTKFLNAPRGGLFYDLMVLPSFIMMPFSVIFGATFAANLWIALSFTGIGYCTYLLSQHITQDKMSSVIAGWLALSSPYLLGYPLTGGVYERLGVWMFPLVLYTTLKYLEEAKRHWLFLLILSYVFVVFGCPIYGIYMGLLFALLLPYLYKEQQRYNATKQFIHVCLGLLLSTILIYAIITQLNDEGSIAPQVRRLNVTLGVGFVPENATLYGLFHPLYRKPIEVFGDAIPTTHYVGWTILVPLLLVLLFHKKQTRQIVLYSTICLIFLVLSLGPQMQFYDGGASLYNPIFYAVSYIIPYLGSIPTSWQMVSIVGCLGAVVVAGWLSTLSQKNCFLVSLVLLLLCGIERRMAIGNLDFRAVPIQPDISFDILDTKEGFLMEIPRAYLDLGLSRDQIFINQIFHQRPTSVAINLGTTKWDMYKPVLGGVSDDWKAVQKCLIKGGFRYVLIHRTKISSKNLPEIKTMGSLIDENSEVILLELPTSQDWVVPNTTIGPEATKHHAEILVGERGINLQANRYIVDDCPIE